MARAVAWHERRFPNAEPWFVGLKLGEECGEVQSAILGDHAGESATGSGDVEEETADVLIAMLVLLGRWYPDADLIDAADAKLATMSDPASTHRASLDREEAFDRHGWSV